MSIFSSLGISYLAVEVNAVLKRFPGVVALFYFQLRTVTARSHMFCLMIENQALHA